MKKQIKNKLKELSDEQYRNFHSSLCPGIENILGVRVPGLRAYAKELFNKENWEKTIKQIDDEYYEEIMLQGMLIGEAKNEDINTILKKVESFIPKINNWAICDTFCAGLKITKKHKEKMWEFIQKYFKSEKEFEIRFAVVMLLDYYIEEKYLKKVFEILRQIKHEGYYVKMAIAWAISICIIKFYEETINYLKKSDIDTWTYNKAIQKAIESYRITEEQKQTLRKMKN